MSSDVDILAIERLDLNVDLAVADYGLGFAIARHGK